MDGEAFGHLKEEGIGPRRDQGRDGIHSFPETFWKCSHAGVPKGAHTGRVTLLLCKHAQACPVAVIDHLCIS